MGYASNKNAIAECNRSGQKMRRADMVEDGYMRGLLVHPDWYDPPHPQEEPLDPEEGIVIERPAPQLLPAPPPAVLSLTSSGIPVQFTWTQADPPASTVIEWELWRSVDGAPALLLADIYPIIPPAIFIQGPDLIYPNDGTAGSAGSSGAWTADSLVVRADSTFYTADGGGSTPGTPGSNFPQVTGLNYSDFSAVTGHTYSYYLLSVTADGGVEGTDGWTSGPSNIITVSV